MKIVITKLFTILILTTAFYLNAQNDVIPLWENQVPNAIVNSDYNETTDDERGRVSRISHPTLSVFVPDNPNGTAVIIFPGGGYAYLAINKEGYKVADWLNTLGITAIILKYRLPSDLIMENKSIGPLQDAQKALRLIREHAGKWHIKKDKIGVIGFSAGGHLAATVSTHYNQNTYDTNINISAKPDFSILVYPVISMNDSIAHKGSKRRLLGENPTKSRINEYSNEKQIDSLTPTTFLVHATNDISVPVENSIGYYLALKKHNVSAELHIYKDGKHGFGLGTDGTNQNWTKHCEAWLRANKFIDN